jgi:hypothetical protein
LIKVIDITENTGMSMGLKKKGVKAPPAAPPAALPIKKSIHSRAKLYFPVTKIHGYLAWKGTGSGVSEKAAIAVAAGIEYIVQEVLSLSLLDGEAPIKEGTRITPRHVNLVIARDAELKGLFAGGIIRGGGVNPIVFAKKPKKTVSAGGNGIETK